MRKILLFMSFTCAASPVFADDARLPEFLHLVAASEACRIQPNQAAVGFLTGLQGRLDEKATKLALEGMKTKVETEIAAQGAVTVCWTTWEKMRAAGFI